MSTVCNHCGGTDIEYDGARGDAVCTGCGSVLEDNIIVSEVTFQEQSTGASSLIGQFVSSEGGGGTKGTLTGSGFHHGLSRDSREVTLQQAKRRLTHLGNLLKLNQHCIDTAFGFFKMALQLNLTRGRKSSIMDTACLYLVCRSEGTPHMLLDFSDVLQINVYSLGRAYLKLSTALHINPPAIDPCLYIHRFAHKLELGDKVHNVSMTALRLVARMKRDWIHHGRRPAGLCGAALLVAARLHNFSRSVKEIARVVKLSEGTIRKRLGDFKDTPSSRLTIDEFLNIDLEQEHDPPCFLEAKKKAKQLQILPVDKEATGLEESVENIEDKDEDLEESEGDGLTGFGGIKMSSVEDIIAKARMTEAFLNVPTAGLTVDLSSLADLVNDENKIEDGTEEQESYGGSKSLEDIKEPKDDGELDLEGISDEEIEQMLLSEDEVQIKSKLWFAENADYLKEMEERKERLAAQQAEKASRPRKRNVKRKKKEQYTTPASSAGEAIERMLVEKKISSKINYDVLRDLDKTLSGGGGGGDDEDDDDMEVDQFGMKSVLAHISEPEQSSSSSYNGLIQSPLNISRIPSGSNRLPSLATRKRTFTPAINKDTPPNKIIKAHTMSMTSTEVDKSSQLSDEMIGLDSSDSNPSNKSKSTEQNMVIEESGPVVYAEEEDEEGEGVGDDDIEDLVYEGDPLLNSDYEDDDFS